MTEKEIKARYKHAVLGFLWILINPLLQMLVIGLVFRFFVPVQVDNYFLFLFAGLLPWNFFSYSLSKTTPMVLNERNLIKKASFPREVIIFSIILSNLFHLFVALGLFIIILLGQKILSGEASFVEILFFTLRFLWIIPITLWLTILVSGFSLLFSSLNVKYRDVNFAVQAILPLWFYATPIVYTLSLLPPSLRHVLYLNPVTTVLELYQAIFLEQPISFSWAQVASILMGVVIFFIGFYFFKKEEPFFDDWV